MTAPAAAITAQCFGAFSLRVGGVPVERWRAGKARSLCQYLLIHRGRLVLREKLHEVLWPGSERRPNSSSLKVAMHSLRQILAVPGDSGEPAACIVHHDNGYRLHADDVWVDLEQFEAFYDSARSADLHDDRETAVEHYRRAVDLYRGDFLAGESADWIDEQREWAKAMTLRALDRLRIGAIVQHDYLQAVDWCRRTLQLDPYQEEAYQTLIYVHGRYGDLGQVKSWYDLCVRRLRGDLDVQPMPATEQLFHRAVRGELRQCPSAPSGPPVLHQPGGWATNCGQHRRGVCRRGEGDVPVPTLERPAFEVG
jgi:two-component SAPR family response regulator